MMLSRNLDAMARNHDSSITSGIRVHRSPLSSLAGANTDDCSLLWTLR
jgi:hypothetical protein